MRFCSLALLLLAAAPSWATGATVRPVLAIDEALLVDDIVVDGLQTSTGPVPLAITEAISSPSVSLAELTHGLVMGDRDLQTDPPRQVAVALDRATRLLRLYR